VRDRRDLDLHRPGLADDRVLHRHRRLPFATWLPEESLFDTVATCTFEL
jgi:hypothetical protein